MKKKILLAVLLFTSSILISPVSHAQLQDFNFSGNDANSYQCFEQNGDLIPTTPIFDSASGEYYCTDSSGNRIQAVLKPPALQELEVLFIRVVYAIWAIVASFSFLLLIYLAYQYLISRGDATQVKAIRDRIVKYIIGFLLVFLAVPILTTFFKLLGINNQVQCYSGLTGSNNVGIGFQFFFTDLCTDPNGAAFKDCSGLTKTFVSPAQIGQLSSIACPTNGSAQTCTTSTKTYLFRCVGNLWKLESVLNI